MSASPSLDAPWPSPQRPHTPDQARPPATRIGSVTMAPKSELLRNALQARRAQHTPTPSPLEARPPPSFSSRSTTVSTPDSSPDAFAEFALSEEQTAPVSPIRRRRPSDMGPPRSKTNRELTVEIERLKDNLMTSNMRVELLKKSNSELQHGMTKAKERIERLEPLEEFNYELAVENDSLKTKLEHVVEQLDRLMDAHDVIRQHNDELAESNKQLSALSKQNEDLWQSQESAIDEAVMYIIKLEEDKNLLTTELKSLKERVGALETASPTGTLVDGTSRYPSRVFSVDESRPSTSHFDSDYYSQPDSPRVKPDNASSISFTPSERSKKFLDLTEDRRKSARDLVKRMSAASLAALAIRSPSPPPAVPQIPAVYQEKQELAEQDLVEAPPRAAQAVPGLDRQSRHVVPQDILDEALQSPPLSDTKSHPRATSHADGLRGLYRPDRAMRSKTSHDLPAKSSQPIDPSNTGGVANSQPSVPEASPSVPSRVSSKYANTSNFNEQFPRHSPCRRHQSDRDMQTSSDAVEVEEQDSAPLRAPTVPPPINPALSTADLTSEYDPREDRDRWWRNVEQITSSPVTPQPRTALHQSIHGCSRMSTGTFAHQRRHRKAPSLAPGTVSTESQSRSTSTLPREERDFLFNPGENVETFMRKARNKISSTRRQA
ncbi:hypothetical protein IAQ61_009981 [Plenodomus lingam]|uniref:uncharacterized protein n=1 Tax=Leptosphaeria maculans TaxID=5022 RepID=UPI00332EE250|nr:hypothetical protein IAQ61_009981 [Plenodomus lingam]